MNQLIKKYKTILWDFDGVILDSMKVRDLGFVKVLQDEGFADEQIDRLLVYHRKNGGLSRYVKFRYFYEEILRRSISDEEIGRLATKFSTIMMDLLIDENLLIDDSLRFIKTNYKKYKFHIVSGSDGIELNQICKELGIDKYFISIQGSPTPKNQLVRELLIDYAYDLDSVCLIGDSINDKEAADESDIDFFGYNNSSLIELASYIKAFYSISYD